MVKSRWLLSLATIVALSAAQPTVSAVHARTLPPALVALTHAWAGIKGYSARVAVFERKGAQAQREVFDYDFRKPNSAIVSIIKGPDAGKTLVWNGGSTLTVHEGTGFTALFKRTFTLHDPQATTIRGSSIDQLSFGAFLAHAQKTPGTISQSAGPVIRGVATDAVTLTPTTPASDTGLTREVIDISRTTHLPVRGLGYAGQTLVRTIDFSNVKLQQ